jgi:hypothetical protein
VKAFIRRLRHREHPPLASSDFVAALRAAAHYAASDEARIEYHAAADALDRAIGHTRRHGDDTTRDDLAYALGRAQLNLREQLTELIEINKDTHLLVQGVHEDQQQQGAAVLALRDEFQTLGESLSGRMASFEARMGMSEQDRAALHEQIDALTRSADQRHADSQQDRQELREQQEEIARQMEQMAGHIAQVLALLDPALTRERQQELIATVMELKNWKDQQSQPASG